MAGRRASRLGQETCELRVVATLHSKNVLVNPSSVEGRLMGISCTPSRRLCSVRYRVRLCHLVRRDVPAAVSIHRQLATLGMRLAARSALGHHERPPSGILASLARSILATLGSPAALLISRASYDAVAESSRCARGGLSPRCSLASLDRSFLAPLVGVLAAPSFSRSAGRAGSSLPPPRSSRFARSLRSSLVATHTSAASPETPPPQTQRRP